MMTTTTMMMMMLLISTVEEREERTFEERHTRFEAFEVSGRIEVNPFGVLKWYHHRKRATAKATKY